MKPESALSAVALPLKAEPKPVWIVTALIEIECTSRDEEEARADAFTTLDQEATFLSGEVVSVRLAD